MRKDLGGVAEERVFERVFQPDSLFHGCHQRACPTGGGALRVIVTRRIGFFAQKSRFSTHFSIADRKMKAERGAFGLISAESARSEDYKTLMGRDLIRPARRR